MGSNSLLRQLNKKGVTGLYTRNAFDENSPKWLETRTFHLRIKIEYQNRLFLFCLNEYIQALKKGRLTTGPGCSSRPRLCP